MKNNFYPVSLTIIFSLLLLFMYYRVSNLEHKYETLKEANVRLKSNSPLTDIQIKERQFKEEMYIRQQESDTTLILLVFTIALGMTAFLTIIPAKREFEARATVLEHQYAKYSTEIKNKHNDFEFRLTDSQADENINKFYFNYDKRDFEMALYYALSALADYTKCYYTQCENNDESFKKHVVEITDSTLDLLIKIGGFKVSYQFQKLIYNSIFTIRTLSNEVIDKKLSILDSNIVYEKRKKFN